MAGRGAPGGAGSHGRTYPASARRGGAVQGRHSSRSRFVAVRVTLVAVLGIAALKLVDVQGFQAEALSEQAQRQRTTVIDIPASRGSIVDRNGTKLAFSVETRTLSVNLKMMRKAETEYAQRNPASGRNFDTRAAAAARFMADRLPNKTTEQELLAKFHKQNADFTYLVDNIEPSVADEITKEFPEIGTEKRAVREYPGGPLAANVVGVANWRMDHPDTSKHNLHGLAGLESARDHDLAGKPGRQLVDTAQGSSNVVIPGTQRDLQPATAGSDLQLTIESDLQYEVQSRLTSYVAKSKAKGGSAVIMDAKTGEVYALANDKTFDPNDLRTANDVTMNNRAVTTPFEPGSVNKVVTAAAAIEAGLATPDSVLSVPGQLPVADHVVHDAWAHGTQNFTTTGIFAKSSNIGTLLLAQKIGEQRFADLLQKFGIGDPTNIGLPGESGGSVPPRTKWSGTTFGNLPIGQGLSMTVVQMAGMYQAIANNGVRVEPRVVRSTVRPDGTVVSEPAPKSVQVVSPQTANTVKDMLRATTQKGKGQDVGTAPAAAVEGYQISGKTGTGQQVDPKTGAYSNSLYNITFAGILPADHPRFVVGIMLDAPDSSSQDGSSAAPLFHDIASYLAQRFQLPLSDAPSPVVPLVLD